MLENIMSGGKDLEGHVNGDHVAKGSEQVEHRPPRLV